MNIHLPVQTERLILRDFVSNDWKAVHHYASDPQVVHFLPFGPSTEEDTKDFIQRVIASQQAKPRQNFEMAVTLKANRQLIGGCRISVTNPDNKGGSIGYCLNGQFWGQGYATEAAKALLDLGFNQLGLHRIYALCDPENEASARVLERIGMRREGYLRENLWIKGKWCDTILYAILEHEWRG